MHVLAADSRASCNTYQHCIRVPCVIRQVPSVVADLLERQTTPFKVTFPQEEALAALPVPDGGDLNLSGCTPIAESAASAGSAQTPVPAASASGDGRVLSAVTTVLPTAPLAVLRATPPAGSAGKAAPGARKRDRGLRPPLTDPVRTPALQLTGRCMNA
jgi:hypothetical protein